MTLQLLDNLWSMRVDETLSALSAQHSLGDFTSPYVAITVTSAYAQPGWSKGGTVSQAITLPDSSPAYGSFRELFLNRVSLLEFPFLTGGSYNLRYFPFFRLGEVQIKVWEYTGQTRDRAVENLVEALETSAVLTVDFSQINARLNTLEAAINAMAHKPQILIRVNGLAANQSKEIRFWEQAQITTALKIESIYIDSPADDKMKIAVFTQDGIKLTEREFNKNETPYDFPDLVLAKSLKVVFTSVNSVINRIFVFCSQVPEAIALDI